jgi:hypothetical protein
MRKLRPEVRSAAGRSDQVDRADLLSQSTTVADRNRYTPNTVQKHQSDGPEWPTDSMPYRRSIIDQSGMSAMVTAMVIGTPSTTITTVVANRCQK